MSDSNEDKSLENDTFEKENYMDSKKKEEVLDLFPGRVKEIAAGEGCKVLVCDNKVKLAVSALSDEILHFRFAPDGHLGDGFSYAAMPENFPDRGAPEMTEDEEFVHFSTNSLQVKISLQGLLLTISDSEGNVMSEDEKGFHWEGNRAFGGNIVQYSRRIQPREHFYGLGDKSCHPEIRGRRFELWGSDTYAYGSETDPLYKNIPFFIGIHHGQAYGIFFDNTHRSFFDFGKERKETSSFWAQGGLMDFYYIHGPTVRDVVRRFAQLTGVPELPPLWSLGFHQCKWSYKTEKEFTDLAQGFLDNRIPCDALYVDIDYMDGYRCFTWNLESFPKPGEMIRKLEAKGFKTVAIIDPGIKVDPGYFVYDEGVAGDHFCRQMDGDIYTGKVWPGDCHFPDFTKPSVRIWWSGLFEGLIAEDGIAGIWNDMNEPADFNEDKTFPRHIRHDYDGHPCSHRRAHNIYGTQMIRATREGIAKFNDGKRPFAITRSAYAGAWRYASAWTGDNISTWEHLRMANIQCQRLNLSGYSFVGSDIGGFLDKTNGELFTRWVQLGIFHPFCRVHSSGEHGSQEPWSFGEPYTSIMRKFIELRYRLLPYIYTSFYQHIQTGDPILRPLIYLDHEDTETFHRADEFTLGDNLVVCPITEAGSEGRWMYLTKGHYYNYWNDELVAGGEEIFCQAKLDQIPFFVRAGALLPLDPVRQYSWEKVEGPQEHHLYLPTEECGAVQSQIYADAGDHYDYQKGDFAQATYTVRRTAADQVEVQVTREGTHPLPPTRIHLHGTNGKPKSVTVDGVPVAAEQIVEAPADYRKIEIAL
ncbi:glycoside hydrolase family 31 protein [Roseibacillus persicicus]|uniref:glycoside hydrolase family 31 protein n=1 Tax=Roseibacillus persicicus TaxID=454148 RepID=UPI00398B8922